MSRYSTVHHVSVCTRSSEHNGHLLRNELETSFRPSLIPAETDWNIFTATVNDSHIYLYDNMDFIQYDCEQNRWFNVCVNKHDTFAPSITSLGSCLYMAGGLAFNDQYPVTTRKEFYNSSSNEIPIRSAITDTGKLFKMYDVREKKWLQLPNMKYSRVKAASCAYNDTIYVSGGDDLTYFENSNVEYYDTRAGKWSEITTRMPKAKMGHCCVACNDHLWFVGGRTQDRHQDKTLFSYNLKENTWSEIFSVPSSFSNRTIDRIVDVHPC